MYRVSGIGQNGNGVPALIREMTWNAVHDGMRVQLFQFSCSLLLGTASGVMEFTVEVPRAVRIKSKRVFVLQAVLHVLAIVVGACPSQCCCLIVRCSPAIFLIFEKPGWAAFEPAVSQLPNMIELLTQHRPLALYHATVPRTVRSSST